MRPGKTPFAFTLIIMASEEDMVDWSRATIVVRLQFITHFSGRTPFAYPTITDL